MQYKSKHTTQFSHVLTVLLLTVLTSFLQFSCGEKKAAAQQSPAGYDITKPKKYGMPDILQEISGFAFNKGDEKVVYAQQDEDGLLFTLPLGTKDETKTKFASKGDYEDVAVAKGLIIMLKSNGTLYTFPIGETKNEEAKNVKEIKDLVPKGEYEGMHADETTGKIYVLCKTCKVDKGTKNASGYILTLQADGNVTSTGTFSVDAGSLDQLTGKKKGAFHPSALAIHPLSKEWFIVSSMNKLLVVTDANFKVKGAYHLSSNEFNQPEGIAFDQKGNLYISNEGSETQVGNILRFDYKKP
jgi:hypothetical protein